MKTVQVRNITIGEGRPKICVPIVGQTKEDILLEAGTFARIPVDVVEWRVDWFEDVFDTDKVLDVAKNLQTVLKDTPILFTFRTAKEGGEKGIARAVPSAVQQAVSRPSVTVQKIYGTASDAHHIGSRPVFLTITAVSSAAGTAPRQSPWQQPHSPSPTKGGAKCSGNRR